MIDPAELGQRIQERRKHQGLTQEQLGNDLLVSPQAVSKWENGESLPDIGTLPALCKALSTSADALLGIDSELGIETLGGKLGQRIGDLRDKEERNAALMTALGFLIPPYDMRKRNRDKNISYQLSDSDKGLVGFSFWSSSGLVCFAGGEVLEKDTPSSYMIDILRTLLAPECWPVACFLLRGPKKFAELLAAELAESSQALADVLDKLIEAGLLVQDKAGYRLQEDYGLLLTGMIKAFCLASSRGGAGLLVETTIS